MNIPKTIKHIALVFVLPMGVLNNVFAIGLVHNAVEIRLKKSAIASLQNDDWGKSAEKKAYVLNSYFKNKTILTKKRAQLFQNIIYFRAANFCNKEGSELSENFGQLKMLADDAKMPATDVADTPAPARLHRVVPYQPIELGT